MLQLASRGAVFFLFGGGVDSGFFNFFREGADDDKTAKPPRSFFLSTTSTAPQGTSEELRALVLGLQQSLNQEWREKHERQRRRQDKRIKQGKPSRRLKPPKAEDCPDLTDLLQQHVYDEIARRLALGGMDLEELLNEVRRAPRLYPRLSLGAKAASEAVCDRNG